jgi:hypothetical protein
MKMARPALKMISGDTKFPNIHEIDYHFIEVAPPSNSLWTYLDINVSRYIHISDK